MDFHVFCSFQLYFALKSFFFFPSDVLDQYKLLLQKKEEARREYQEQLNEMNSPDMQRQKKEMEERQKELQEIERLLGSYKNYEIWFNLLYVSGC